MDAHRFRGASHLFVQEPDLTLTRSESSSEKGKDKDHHQKTITKAATKSPKPKHKESDSISSTPGSSIKGSETNTKGSLSRWGLGSLRNRKDSRTKSFKAFEDDGDGGDGTTHDGETRNSFSRASLRGYKQQPSQVEEEERRDMDDIIDRSPVQTLSNARSNRSRANSRQSVLTSMNLSVQRPVLPSRAGSNMSVNARRVVKALFDYTATTSDELSFNVGDEIVMIAEVSDGWWEGELIDGEGKAGLFPLNHTEEIVKKPVPPPRPPTQFGTSQPRLVPPPPPDTDGSSSDNEGAMALLSRRPSNKSQRSLPPGRTRSRGGSQVQLPITPSPVSPANALPPHDEPFGDHHERFESYGDASDDDMNQGVMQTADVGEVPMGLSTGMSGSAVASRTALAPPPPFIGGRPRAPSSPVTSTFPAGKKAPPPPPPNRRTPSSSLLPSPHVLIPTTHRPAVRSKSSGALPRSSQPLLNDEDANSHEGGEDDSTQSPFANDYDGDAQGRAIRGATGSLGHRRGAGMMAPAPAPASAAGARASADSAAVLLCADCGCDDFVQNPFKPRGHCSSCFHSHA